MSQQNTAVRRLCESGAPCSENGPPVAVDLATSQLVGPRDCSHVTPTALRVLYSLHQREGSLVSRRELIDKHWERSPASGERCLTQTIWELRGLLQDIGGDRNWILTVPRRGYALREGVIGFDECEPDLLRIYLG